MNEMQTMVDDQPTGAHKFLNFVIKNRDMLHFLDRDRAYLIAEFDQRSGNRLSWHRADASDKFVFMLEALQESDKYHGQHPDSNFAERELWRMPGNRGFNSQGKLKEYAKMHNMDYNTLQHMVQFQQKAGAIEAELDTPGLSTTLFFAGIQIRRLKETEIGLFCELFSASDSFAFFKSYAPTGLALRDDFKALMKRRDLDQWIVKQPMYAN